MTPPSHPSNSTYTFLQPTCDTQLASTCIIYAAYSTLKPPQRVALTCDTQLASMALTASSSLLVTTHRLPTTRPMASCALLAATAAMLLVLPFSLFLRRRFT
jgi:hypothetical protein